MDNTPPEFWETLGLMYRLHPWHGLDLGDYFPDKMNVYIEIVPADGMKFELDKISGILKIDRPQRYSNHCPAPYGFAPRTLCGPRVASFCMSRSGREGIIGDNDPLDVCVLCESNINHGNVLLRARPVGGLRMLDGNESDDKIIAVLDGDLAYSHVNDIEDLPTMLVDRLRHYFLTYKEIPGKKTPKTEITDVYGRDEAVEIIERSRADYDTVYGEVRQHHDRVIAQARKRMGKD
ncbi:MAG: inorganic pyrophosphatase [Candidatus Sumerlaeaceae bacterium]|nr:inorganic pyrophosphatase [Candidatus Sumerlaeaceae bacterium]